MSVLDTQSIADAVESAIGSIACRIESGCLRALKQARAKESRASAAFALDVMLDNARLAERESRPVCQDTGMVIVFVELGQQVRLQGALLDDAIHAAVARAYRPLRKSVLDPITRVNTGDNTPAVIHTSIVAGDSVKLEIMLKGFGSENMSAVTLLNPAQGLECAKDFIVDTVAHAASNPCPPVIVGVGLGGTLEKACLLSKHALMRSVGTPNPDAQLDELERELLARINALGIGAQGFGGDTTALAVHIERFATHISSLPVAVNILCHCSRSATIVLQGE